MQNPNVEKSRPTLFVDEDIEEMSDIIRSNPIVPIILSHKNRHTTANVWNFIQKRIEDFGDDQLPLTLTEFYHDYTEYILRRNIQVHNTYYEKLSIDTTVEVIKLANLAYRSHVRNEPITEELVQKTMRRKLILCPEDQSQFSSESHRKVTFATFNLLKRDGFTTGGKPAWRFREQIIRDYLLARFLREKFLNMVDDPRFDGNVGTGHVLECMRHVADTSDTWRMVFALLNDDANTRDIQPIVLTELIDVAKTAEGVTSYDVTSLCVEAIYESKNKALLTQNIDDYTLNQTLNYSSTIGPQARLLYAVSAVGYFVRASEQIYGLHMSNYGLTADRVAMLSDPINARSDNNLQVLNLSGNPFGYEGMRRLVRFFVKASFLTHLDLSACALSCRGVGLLSEYFMCLPLVYLSVAGNKIHDKGMLRALNNFKYLLNIEFLDFSRNCVTDASSERLATELPHLTQLRTLDLRHNLLGDLALCSLAHVVTQLPRVEHVLLAENCDYHHKNAGELLSHVTATRATCDVEEIPPEGVLSMRRVSLSRDGHEFKDIDDETTKATTTGAQGDAADGHDTSLNTTTCDSHVLQDDDVTANVSFDVISPEAMQSSVAVDLLAGRPDREQAVPLRRSFSTRMPSFPRMRDVRRSWHGLNTNLRESMRRSGESVQQGFRTSSLSLRESIRRSSSRLNERFFHRTASFEERPHGGATAASTNEDPGASYPLQTPVRVTLTGMETAV